MTPPAPLPAPDAAGWTLAAGVSISLHIGLAAALMLGLSGAPGAAPGPEMQITLRSVPQIAGAGPEQTARLAAAPPDTRLQAQEDPARADLSARPEALSAQRTGQNLRPDQDLSLTEELSVNRAVPTVAERRATEPTTAETAAALAAPRLAALAPDRPVPAPQTRPSDRALPATPQAERSVQRLQPLPETPLRAATPTRPIPAPAPTQALSPDAAPTAATAPTRLQAEGGGAEEHAAPTRLRPEGMAPPASAAPPTTSRTQPSARPPPEALRMAMQPPTQDTLERALRDRPRTFLSDRRAAPRPDRRSAAEGGATMDAPDQPLHAAVLDHLLALPDIPCFAAMPSLDDAGLLRVEVFGPGQTGLEAFRDGLEGDTGPIPGLTVQQVTQGQCETLDFIRRSRAYPGHDLYMTLGSRRIDSGGRLQGEIHQAGGRALALLLVDNAGRVQSLERYLTRQPDGTGFEIPMTLQGAPVETWQLLLAVATDSPLQTVTTLSGPQEAATVFARLRAEIATRGLTPDLALTAFSLN